MALFMSNYKCVLRACKLCTGYTKRYLIQPPAWLGGKNILEKSGRFTFPEFIQTFDERLADEPAKLQSESVPLDIGLQQEVVRPDRKQRRAIAISNHKNKDLEQAARLHNLLVPLDAVKAEWKADNGPTHIKTIAEHYGVFKDLFGGACFMPVVDLHVGFDYDEDTVTPVFYGNRITPSEAKSVPHVDYPAVDQSLWTLLLTNPDSHLTDNDSEYVHWLVGNIPASDVTRGEVLVDYLQPIPARGTGWHRHVFVLFKQNGVVDFTAWKRDKPSLADRTFQTRQFYGSLCDNLTPAGLCFFQTQWDESVRETYHKTLDMAEPTYEYAYPPPYHPTPKSYPHKQPFDRYLDRYRDKKDIAEEVLRIKLKMISPFAPQTPRDKYPLLHQDKHYKPSWLRVREEMMHRRREQFRDLP